MPTTTFSSPRIAKAFSQQFGKEVKTVKVDMKYEKEVCDFIRRVETAQQLTEKSQTSFK